MTKVFPFDLQPDEAKKLLVAYAAKNREMLDERYGTYHYVGISDDCPTGQRKIWCWNYAEAIVINHTTVDFYTYWSWNATFDGRGQPQEKIRVKYKSGSLHRLIDKRKFQLAECEYERREAERLEGIRKAGIEAVFNELFLKETSNGNQNQ